MLQLAYNIDATDYQCRYIFFIEYYNVGLYCKKDRTLNKLKVQIEKNVAISLQYRCNWLSV
jgi:hypothetical protein